MVNIEYLRLKKEISHIKIFLTIIIGFSIYNILKHTELDYFEPVMLIVLSVITIIPLSIFSSKATKMLKSGDVGLNLIENFFYGNAIIFLIGITGYVFFLKGLYGLYQLFNSFSWYLLFFRIIITYGASYMIYSLTYILDAYKYLSNGTWKYLSNDTWNDEK